jgi:ParB family chromosome partitioning protein
VNGLYPNADRFKRRRLRTLAFLAEEVAGVFAAPEKLTEPQALRVAAALEAGLGDRIRTALAGSDLEDPDHQWDLIRPILAEPGDDARKPAKRPAPDRPRAILRPRPALTVRRERTREGWTLHFSGREATGAMMDKVMDDIERMYAPG